jgi:hypothetical protein
MDFMNIESNLLGITIADVTLFDKVDAIVTDPILLEFSDIMIKHQFSKNIDLI